MQPAQSTTTTTTTKVKTQQVTRSRGQHCGDVELAGYLANQAGPVPLVLDLRITHERFGRSSDLSINGNLHYPNDKDRSLNEAADDKILKYRADYNTILLYQRLSCRRSLVPLGGYIVYSLDYYSCRLIGKLTAFLQLQEFSLRNRPVEASFTLSARRSSRSCVRKSAAPSPRLQLYVLILI